MANDYTLNWSDGALKSPFTLTGGTIDSTTTTLTLTGKGAANWGEPLQENLLHLLENFASTTAPTSPTEGQLWYDATGSNKALKIYNGTTWITIASQLQVSTITVPVINPTTPKNGDIQVVGSVISIYANGAWRQVFPAQYS